MRGSTPLLKGIQSMSNLKTQKLVPRSCAALVGTSSICTSTAELNFAELKHAVVPKHIHRTHRVFAGFT